MQRQPRPNPGKASSRIGKQLALQGRGRPGSSSSKGPPVCARAWEELRKNPAPPLLTALDPPTLVMSPSRVSRARKVGAAVRRQGREGR